MMRWLEVARRLLRDPRLVGSVLSKFRSRWTLSSHRNRVEELPKRAGDSLEIVVGEICLCEKRVARSVVEEGPLSGALRHLEEWLTASEEGSGRSGSAYLELLYALVRLTRPQTVVETGVGQGFGTTVILAALEKNGLGTLWSTDLPAFHSGAQELAGKAIPEELKKSFRWRRMGGPDRRVLPKILSQADSIDLFHYDSDKSYEGMIWAQRQVWPLLNPGGVFIVDDVHSSDAFLDFADEVGQEPWILPKPVDQRVYRWSKPFYVGLLRKPERV